MESNPRIVPDQKNNIEQTYYMPERLASLSIKGYQLTTHLKQHVLHSYFYIEGFKGGSELVPHYAKRRQFPGRWKWVFSRPGIVCQTRLCVMWANKLPRSWSKFALETDVFESAIEILLNLHLFTQLFLRGELTLNH